RTRPGGKTWLPRGMPNRNCRTRTDYRIDEITAVHDGSYDTPEAAFRPPVRRLLWRREEAVFPRELR
ncbi:MAG: hypothetical protein ACLQVL_20145, partial [Terriglobia bacterium]